MMIKNNKGFGSREILTVSVVCLLLAAILLTISIQTSHKEKRKVFEYNARLFGSSATTYQIENNNHVVYMIELLDNGLFTRVKNPFGGDKYCDITESKVDYEDGKKYVTLRCGNYLIDHQALLDSHYRIYKVSEWMSEKPKGDFEELVAYNYKKNGEDGFDVIYNDVMFLYAFNKQMDSDYEKIEEIPSNYHVYFKTLYRTKTLVDTVLVESKEKE